MMKFIYNLVKKYRNIDESDIIKEVLNEYDWCEYSRWQMKRTIIDKLTFLSDVGLLNLDIERIIKGNDYNIIKRYSIGKYNIDEFPSIRLRCKLGAMFYGGSQGEGFSYPLFRFENLSYDIDNYNKYLIEVHYNGSDAKECSIYMKNIVKEELSKLYER